MRAGLKETVEEARRQFSSVDVDGVSCLVLYTAVGWLLYKGLLLCRDGHVLGLVRAQDASRVVVGRTAYG